MTPVVQESTYPSARTLLMEVESAVSGILPEFLINTGLGSDLVTEKALTCMESIKHSGIHPR